MIIKWDDSFLVNIEDVDKQHMKLVSTVNKLGETMAEGAGKKSLAAIIDEIVSYTKIHFETEERILRLVKYPELEQHLQEHTSFIDSVTDFQIKFDREQIGLTIEIMNFLCDWVRNHVKKTDQEYARYIQENNKQP